jgi:hypothetical protein
LHGRDVTSYCTHLLYLQVLLTPTFSMPCLLLLLLPSDPKGAAKTAATAIASAESSGKGQAVSQALAEAVSTGGAASAQAFAQAVVDNVNSGKGGAAASVSGPCMFLQGSKGWVAV